jgi:serine/threonine-protein kinase
VTRLAGPGTPAPPSTTSRSTRSGPHNRSGKSLTSSSWLASTAAIDHGRFEPGTLLDERYRIVGRLGKGGMGEVYRADDLRLGQQVALKFLPESVDADPARLTQLHTEVRMARQVSHPNVCRVYDAGEFDGHTFLSMEYVDGEDLASLIRRVGRFPQDRAIELARQICAGLAAAHDRGVVHRDLKPAQHHARRRRQDPDHGLRPRGATGEVLAPARPPTWPGTAGRRRGYAAQRHLRPRARALRALHRPPRARRRQHGRAHRQARAGRHHAPSDIVKDLDPGIERVVMRCLEPDPARRPGSALGVSAALPGGDPLAAALAAGETPSPEMVAAAGTSGAVPSPRGRAARRDSSSLRRLACCSISACMMINSSPLPKPPAALIDRAQEIVAEARRTATTSLDRRPASRLARLGPLHRRTTSSRGSLEQLRARAPETLRLWYRTSPVVLLRSAATNRSRRPIRRDVSGMTLVVVDAAGRLAELLGVPQPPRSRRGAAAQPTGRTVRRRRTADERLHPVAPQWRPPVYADERAAWEGAVAGRAGGAVESSAAADGRPVFFASAAVDGVVRDPARRQPSTLERVTGSSPSLVMPG